ncbi:MAG: hypothetical protein AUK48_12020 [Oscillatoriales cyanobacterium CG2_30_44_21]|nr:MAG: hypothetical protein AUK48_12020 [Oscillatoriales cyanobacterium CG2_30_44_21]
MKVAMLIMAHHQPSHLAKLIKALNCDWIHFFIHLDKKVDIDEFVKMAPKANNITFLDNNQRVKVYWAGYSQVKAILIVLNTARQREENFDRFCLISGSDFPIKSVNQIEEEFNTKKEFMRIDRQIGESYFNSHRRFVKYLHFMDYPLLKRFDLSEKISRKIYKKINLYHGSTWWSLTSECVDYIMKFLNSNRDYINFHRWTLSSDEIFFHSIVKNSPFASNISHDFEQLSSPDNSSYFELNEHGCTYIDWNAKNIILPKVLVEEDFNNLTSSQCLFARKFDHIKSARLIEMLQEKYLLDI